jgi:23S rRNA (uridine2552-2'-O)-methyltransferase
MTNQWIERRKKDQYYKLAKLKGYRSRAAYKLLQTIRTYKLILPGQRVVDLGAQPGGWLQIAREVVGPEGFVLGVDIKPIDPLPYPNVKTIEADVHAKGLSGRIISELNGPADVVLSDLAPGIIGAWDVDHARQVDLARAAMQLSQDVLKRGGNVFIKLFHGPELKRFQEETDEFFGRSRLLKPKASRPESSEVYYLGLDFKLKWMPPEPKL